MHPEQVIAEVFGLYERFGDDDYIGEPVSQIEHMAQAAQYAQQEGFEGEVVLAAFFHGQAGGDPGRGAALEHKHRAPGQGLQLGHHEARQQAAATGQHVALGAFVQAKEVLGAGQLQMLAYLQRVAEVARAAAACGLALHHHLQGVAVFRAAAQRVFAAVAACHQVHMRAG